MAALNRILEEIDRENLVVAMCREQVQWQHSTEYLKRSIEKNGENLVVPRTGREATLDRIIKEIEREKWAAFNFDNVPRTNPSTTSLRSVSSYSVGGVIYNLHSWIH